MTLQLNFLKALLTQTACLSIALTKEKGGAPESELRGQRDRRETRRLLTLWKPG